MRAENAICTTGFSHTLPPRGTGTWPLRVRASSTSASSAPSIAERRAVPVRRRRASSRPAAPSTSPRQPQPPVTVRPASTVRGSASSASRAAGTLDAAVSEGGDDVLDGDRSGAFGRLAGGPAEQLMDGPPVAEALGHEPVGEIRQHQAEVVGAASQGLAVDVEGRHHPGQQLGGAGDGAQRPVDVTGGGEEVVGAGAAGPQHPQQAGQGARGAPPAWRTTARA